jgi:hypothetical protein
LLRTFLDWKVTFEAIAAKNPALVTFKLHISHKISSDETQEAYNCNVHMKIKLRNNTILFSNEGADDAYQLKEASEIDANATPPTIGRRDKITQGVGSCTIIHVSEQNHKRTMIFLEDAQLIFY